MSLIIFEGPDGAGKTTLINELTKRWKWVDVHHHGAYLNEKEIAKHYLHSCYAGLRKPNVITVMDRSWMAEPIYGDVMRNGENRITRAQERMLERVALGAGAVFVACLPALETCLDSWRRRKAVEYPKQSAQLEKIWHGYEELFKLESPFCASMDYDRDHGNFTEIADTIEAAVEASRNYSPAIGAPASTHPTLLIGDRANHGGIGVFSLPFVSVHTDGGCSTWLTNQLDEWGVYERQLAWVNQHDLDPADFDDLAAYEKIVALGGHAEAWCERYDLEFSATYHPQYWKRFHFKETYPLKELL